MRLCQGGEVLQTIDLDRGCFACMLGGTNGKTLFMLAAEWRPAEALHWSRATRRWSRATRRGPPPVMGDPQRASTGPGRGPGRPAEGLHRSWVTRGTPSGANYARNLLGELWR